jgi:uncharacterized protein YndB with AHSA1/START domain
MSTVIDSSTERVWRALTNPDELVLWDVNLVAAADGVDRYPFQGQHARWRYRLGSVQLVMHDRPLEVEPPNRLRSQLRMGSMGYERTFSLQPIANGGTRLSMRVTAPNSIPLVGETVDRFDVRQMSTQRVDTTLRALRTWCEANPLAGN